MGEYSQRVAVITGAASGIGRALAVELARRGCNLALSDVDEAGLEEMAAAAAEQGVHVTTAVVDVSRREAVVAWAETIMADHARVDLLVNNAGVAQTGTVSGNSLEDYEWVMAVNFWGVLHGTQVFLPVMREAGRGHIVNVASLFGLLAQPGMSAYNASKFAVRGLTESLRQELDVLDCGVTATCVLPGGIKTNITHTARISPSIAEMHGQEAVDEGELKDEFSNLLTTTPEKAALAILKGVKKNKRRVLIGWDAKSLDWLQRLMPSFYQRLVGLAMKYYFSGKVSELIRRVDRVLKKLRLKSSQGRAEEGAAAVKSSHR